MNKDEAADMVKLCVGTVQGPSPMACIPMLHPVLAAEMEERVQGYPGPYVSDSDDEEEVEEEPEKPAEQDNLDSDPEDEPPKPNTPEFFFEESENTDWLIDDVKDQRFLEQEQDDSDSSDRDEQD